MRRIALAAVKLLWISSLLPATAAALTAHDSVVLPLRAKAIRIPAGAGEVATTVRVVVRNADVLPERETPGHEIRLLASSDDCPAGTLAGAPDFDRRVPGAQDTILLRGGRTKAALVPLRIGSGFTSLNAKTPTRCTLRFTAYALPFGATADATPSNNVATLELDVVDLNDADQAVAEAFVGGAPRAVSLRAGAPSKQAALKVGNGDLDDLAGVAVTAVADDGDCPSGMVGAFDVAPSIVGAQNAAAIPGGTTLRGLLPLSIAASALPPASRLAPIRCTATVTAVSPGADGDASNNDTRVVVEITGGTAAATPPPAAPLPVLIGSDPADGASLVPRSAWIRLHLSGAIDPVNFGGFTLGCDSVAQSLTAHLLAADVVVVNPAPSLPPGASCILSWESTGGPASLSFSTAAAGAPASVLYDRTNTARTAPFPDDYWVGADATTRTGLRLNAAVPSLGFGEQSLFTALLHDANQLDGFSPIAHFTIETSAPVDPGSLPATGEESLDPLASIGLFDIDPNSPTLGQRVPFRLLARSDTLASTSHTLLLFPAIPLSPRGRYGLVITRNALVDATRPLDPSAFFAAALAAPLPGEAAAVTRARELSAEVLDAVAAHAALPIPNEDVALALRISVRSTDDLPDELVAIRQQVQAAPPPAITVTSVTAETMPGSQVAAFVRGTWAAPEFRTGLNFARDGAGAPLLVGSTPIAFILALPVAALSGPVPVVMYQHGNPGDSETEVPSLARSELAPAGLALIGFRDVVNREVSPTASTPAEAGEQQITATLLGLLTNQTLPDYWIQTNAEQLAFVRAIQQLGGLDVLPVGAADGDPELNLAAPLTYFGISEGAVHAPALLAYEPGIRAAALVVGGARLAESIIHQQAAAVLSGIGAFFPGLTPADIWVGFGLFQTDFDRQDAHNQAPFIYRHPLRIAGTTRRASILVTEGLDDSFVPNNSTESLAWSLGPLPHLQPVQRSVPFLSPVAEPVSGNIDDTTTAAFYQFVPAGVSGIDPTPGCELEPEGHFCPQVAPAAQAQRIAFLLSAISDPAPSIGDPLGP